jgi:hypothetical protein
LASNVTLQVLRDQARARADMQNSGFIADTELDFYINSEIQELYDLLTTTFEDYYVTSSPFTVAANVSTVNVPSDFYKLRGVDIEVSPGSYSTAIPFMFQERNRLSNPLLYPNYEQNLVMYRLRGQQLSFTGSQGGFNGQMWYIPVFTKLINASDTFDGINGYEEYVIVGAAIRMLQKEESDTRVLLAIKQDLRQRVENSAANRDAGTPERVTDMTNLDSFPYRGFY